MTDASSKLGEHATYCRPNDDKRPELVGLPDATTSQICPIDKSKGADEVTNAYPDGWFVRVMFDELLDPNIEGLVDTATGGPCDTTAPDATCSGTIAASHPVDLQCQSVVNGQMTSVSYDGYYSPSGNAVTWPLGPSLVIKPNDPKSIATNIECQVTLNGNITDKDGNPVPDNERGPYKFKIAPITVVSIDPSDDPDYKSPIPALQIYYDNPFIQFNTTVDTASVAAALSNEGLFSIKDVAHPDEGPGYCRKANDGVGGTCGSKTDCGATDKLCGRGFCKSPAGAPCNAAADCSGTTPICNTLYDYNYAPYGGDDTQFGIGPPEPIETEHHYVMSFTEGAKLKDRCGAETTLPAPTADNFMQVHFATEKFDFVKATIANGETASAMKRLQYNWNNVLNASDYASGPTSAGAIVPSDALSAVGGTSFTLSPLPKVMTGECNGTSPCPTADIALSDLLILSSDGSGQVALQGHYQMNTEYTATLKAGTVVKDFYGKSYTQTSDSVIKWKTAPAIVMSGISVRQPGTLVNITDGGTVVKDKPDRKFSVRLAFNASMDPTTLSASAVTVEAADTKTPAPPTLAVATDPSGRPLPSGCGYFETSGPNDLSIGDNSTGYIGACSMILTGLFQPGKYKITLKKDATFKDIFGTAYTQAADQSITITVVDAPAAVQCL